MSNNGKKRTHRDRRERDVPEAILERVPKKYRGGNDTVGDTDQQEDGAAPQVGEPLDPVAEARKALEMFEEVSGETVISIIPKKDTTTKEKKGQKFTDRIHNNANGKNNHEKRAERRKKEVARQKEDEEEKARQRKRIEDGEAKRRQFRPKIAGLQDTNCLL